MTDFRSSFPLPIGVVGPAPASAPTYARSTANAKDQLQDRPSNVPGPELDTAVAPLNTHGLLAEEMEKTEGPTTILHHPSSNTSAHQLRRTSSLHSVLSTAIQQNQLGTEVFPYSTNRETASGIRKADATSRGDEARIYHAAYPATENVHISEPASPSTFIRPESKMSEQVNLWRSSESSRKRGVTIKPNVSSYPPLPSPPATRMRKYHALQKQPMQDTHYFLQGRLMTGGDNLWPLIGSVIIVLGLGGLWLGTTGVWIWRDGLGGGGAGRGGKAAVIIFGYLFAVCFGAMMATAFRDPGILPRNLDITYPVAQTSSGAYEPATREVKVRNGTIMVKYCETCKLYRPPRSSHCRLCGNCVEGIDHHCSYLHNCVGKRNYTSFITFLVTSVLALVYTVVFSALHYSILSSREDINFGTALGRAPEAAVSFILGLILLGPIVALLGYHLRLMIINATTVEQIRASASKEFLPKGERPINHFTFGSYVKNFAYSVCRPQNPSWIDASGWEAEDRRKVNPGINIRRESHSFA